MGGTGGSGSILRLHHPHGHGGSLIGGNRLSASRVWTPEDPRGGGANGGGGAASPSTSSSRPKRGTTSL